MKRRLDSIIIGGAMLFGSIAHNRAGSVAKQVDELEDAIEAVEDQLREVGSRPERPAIPGMPLPTGYGLQVRGPDNENIVLPVCLPPGFELESMVLCPEFLPRDQPQQEPVTTALTAAAPAAPERPVVLEPEARVVPAPERFSGTLQYVFGTGDPVFSMDETFGGAVEADVEADAQPVRHASGIETHHLA
jgi:hypothetical protein